MRPIDTIEAFDLFLRDRGLRFDAVVIGGAALSLLGVVSRPTKDIDILVPEIPQEIHIALAPTLAELENVLTWLQLHDANPDWPEHVRNTIADVAKRISHDV
jgi:hypothetical protein